MGSRQSSTDIYEDGSGGKPQRNSKKLEKKTQRGRSKHSPRCCSSCCCCGCFSSNNLALHDATAHNDVTEISDLLFYGKNPNEKDSQGWTPLHVAASHKCSMEVVRLLVDAGADPSSRDKLGYTPLHIAASCNNYEIVQPLVDAGADPEAHEHIGFSPLHIAAVHNNAEMVRPLVNAGAHPESRDRDGDTPLHRAACAARKRPASWEHRMVVPLVEAGADPSTRNLVVGWTALHYAADMNARELAEVLLSVGIDTEVQSKFGYTALEWAERRENHEVIDVLTSTPDMKSGSLLEPEKTGNTLNLRKSKSFQETDRDKPPPFVGLDNFATFESQRDIDRLSMRPSMTKIRTKRDHRAKSSSSRNTMAVHRVDTSKPSDDILLSGRFGQKNSWEKKKSWSSD